MAENLAEVHAIVVPTTVGLHDGKKTRSLRFGWPGASAWHCAPGPGPARTTAIFSRDDELKELIGIPEGVTQIVLLPVA